MDEPSDRGGAAATATPFTEVPIEIRVSVGHARPTIRELLALGHDAILPLDRKIEDPVELYVGDLLIARGTLEEIDDGEEGGLAVRLTEVVDPAVR